MGGQSESDTGGEDHRREATRAEPEEGGAGDAGREDPEARIERALADCRLAEVRAAESERLVQELSAELRAARAAASASSLVLAKASHELRTPLSGIIGLAEILRHKVAAGTIGPAETGRLAGSIHESGVHLLNLVEALLDLSRLEITELATPRAIGVRDEVDVALRALGLIAERKGIAVENACDPGTRWTVDRRVFRQVAINLASNAMKFSPPGSRVRIAATESADALELHVGDEGPGVAEDERERILLPFERGRDAERDGIEGVGLGLTVVAELLKQQGGRLIIDSVAGAGSVFTAVFSRRPPGEGS